MGHRHRPTPTGHPLTTRRHGTTKDPRGKAGHTGEYPIPPTRPAPQHTNPTLTTNHIGGSGLSEPDLLAGVVRTALRHAGRCSSDPVCSTRTPHDPEDFLHGAACHCCTMASETTCERANRFLDRRFLLSLPGSDLGFFGAPHQW